MKNKKIKKFDSIFVNLNTDLITHHLVLELVSKPSPLKEVHPPLKEILKKEGQKIVKQKYETPTPVIKKTEEPKTVVATKTTPIVKNVETPTVQTSTQQQAQTAVRGAVQIQGVEGNSPIIKNNIVSKTKIQTPGRILQNETTNDLEIVYVKTKLQNLIFIVNGRQVKAEFDGVNGYSLAPYTLEDVDFLTILLGNKSLFSGKINSSLVELS